MTPNENFVLPKGKRLKGCTARIVPNNSAFRKRNPIDVWERLRAQVLAKKGAAPISECGPVEIPLPSLAVLCHDIPCRAGSLYNTTT